MVETAVNALKNKYNLEISDCQYNSSMSSANFGYDYREYRYLRLFFTFNGEEVQLHLSSDPVGDGRYDNILDSVESIVAEVERQAIVPRLKVFEGVVRDIGEYDSEWQIADYRAIDVLYQLQNKKIKIEILE